MSQQEIVREAPPADGPAARTEKVALYRQWYLVGILTLIYVVNSLDRGALNLIVNPIRADLGISDVQVSVLLGMAFVILYSILIIPAGYLADLVSRRVIVTGAVVFWSCMASMCGFANSYWQLFAGRVGLGVGELMLPPASYALLRDGVRSEHRATAFAIYHLGPTLGGGVGAVLGGSIFALGTAGAFHGWPLVGDLRPWQLVIAIPGLCGIPIALLMLTTKEPARVTAVSKENTASYGELFRYVFRHWRLYLPLFGSASINPMASSGWLAWFPAALARTWGFPLAQIGHITGTLTLICVPLNAILLGYFMDRYTRGGRFEKPQQIATVVTLLQLVPAVIVFLTPNETVMWTCYMLYLLLNGGSGIACSTALSRVTPERLMGKITSFYILSSNLIGLAFGPTLFALVSGAFFTGPHAIAYSIMVCYPVLMGITAVFLGFGALEVRRFYALPESRRR